MERTIPAVLGLLSHDTFQTTVPDSNQQPWFSLYRPPSPHTLLDSFLYAARNIETVENHVVECGYEKWTYGDLDIISTGLAIEIKEIYGLKPTIATFSENHPYILAVMLATWKLGGVYAPLDHHTPQKLVQHMINNIEPTFVVIPSGDELIKQLLREMNVHSMIFDIRTTSMTSLTQRFLNQSPDLSAEAFPIPSPSDIALFLHTSSASSISNVKCVPLAHGYVFSGCQSRLAWWQKNSPHKDFMNLRVLGWSPWSHILGISHDLGAATFATAGCYIFGIIPSTYTPQQEVTNEHEGELDVVSRLFDVAIRIRPDVFSAVPWILEGFRDKWSREKVVDKKEAMQNVLEKMKVFGCGGAALSKEMVLWAKDMNIFIILDVGMTELGGPLFYSKADDDLLGWSATDCLIPDAELRLVNEDSDGHVEEGELVIISRMISRGYLGFDNSALTKAPDGRITFRTGDVYARTVGDRLVWKGRKEDYIQMISGEILDPRPIEKALNTSSAILHSCVIGNHFLGRPAEFICVLIQPANNHSGKAIQKTSSKAIITSEITRAVASVNRTLPPPLRIAWSRVIILDEDHEVPYTRKGTIFRKKLESIFGGQVARLLVNGNVEGNRDKSARVSDYREGPTSSQWSKADVMDMVLKIVADALQISIAVLSSHSESSFVEFGMDSRMAVRIVNELNHFFGLHLPLNTCYTFLDLVSLSGAVVTELGMNETATIEGGTAKPPNVKSHEEVVIVGQALRLPGDINTPESFWQALVNKRDIMTPIPPDRWDQASFYRSPSSTVPPQTCDITFEKAGFIEVANFDNNFFGISAPEAFCVSPTIRLTLETAFEALENANIPISRVKGTDMGVFVAAGLDGGYQQLLFHDQSFGACGRLSYLLDVHGPSITTDTACSSGLVVFDQAVKYLQSGEGESAIVCAVNTNLWPGSFGFLSAQQMASPRSRCATFTSEADGYVPSEGVVAFILKTRSAASRDGDSILVVVKSTDVKHGGRSQGLVSPNVNTQITLQNSLLHKAGLKPSEIDFVEAHGTGTSLGDIIEIQGINQVFQHSHSSELPLVVGAAKSCIGHTEIAAGLVGVLKAITSFRHSAIPGLMHLTEGNMNSSIDCGIIPMHIPHELFPLPTKENGTPYRSVVLANGFAGTIAGVVLEDPKPVTPMADLSSKNETIEDFPMLFVVSAKSPEALTQYLLKYLKFCRTASASNFRSICYTTCLGREHYRYRFACVVSNIGNLIKVLEDRLDSVSSPARSTNSAACRIAFAFPGQGSYYQAMASDLVARYPGFKDILDSAASTASMMSGYPISSLLADAKTSCDLAIDNSQVAQICIFVYQYSICTWLKQLGIKPQAILGHSLGEIAAAVIGGALPYETGLDLVVTRARLLRSDPAHPGGMAIVGASQERVLHIIHELGLDDQLVIAVYNSHESHVISGGIKAIDSFLSSANTWGFRCARIDVDQGFHSPCISSGLPPLREWLAEHCYLFSPLNIPMYSTVYGKEIRGNQLLSPDYWVEHARDPVKFSDAVEALYSSKSIDIIVDIGPQPFIWTTLQSFSRKNVVIATCGKHSNNQNVAFLSAIASLFETGFTPDFGKLLAHKAHYGHMSSLPTYPFQRQRYYPTSIPSRNAPPFLPPVLPPPQTNPLSAIRFHVDQSLCDLLLDHKIEGHRVAPGASLVDFFANLCPERSVKTIKFNAPLVLNLPESPVFAEFTNEHHFAMYENNSRTNMVCSGIAASKAPKTYTGQHINFNPNQPDQVLTKDEVYRRFKNGVEFGSAFRNIQEYRRWSNHADSIITVEPTEHPTHDRIRKLDSCLHMFGALAFEEVPQSRDIDGAFLPTALEDFTLHSDELPTSFICRYYLPLDISRNVHVISAAFDVFSFSGALLVSCRKYSVAWIPAGLVIRNKQPSADIQWLQQSWVARDIPSVVPDDKLEVLCIVDQAQSRMPWLFKQMAWKTHFFNLHDLTMSRFFSSDNVSFQLDAIIDRITGADLLVVVDVTSNHASPTSDAFCSSYRHILTLMKLLVSSKVRFKSLVFISEMSVPIDDERFPAANLLASTPPTVGSVIQGMLRVFRREMGLDEVIWALDLPPMNTLEDDVILDIISNEIHSRLRGVFTDRTVAYRNVERTKNPNRLVPVLQITDHHQIREVSGTSVVVGLGSIGHALAPSLAGGRGHVVFIGRRHPHDREVQEELFRLQSKTDGRCAYMQADVCNIDSLRNVLTGVQNLYGPIENIVHTAAVVSDATIQTVTEESFELVLRPKVIGAWNLHVISDELKLPLKSFVLLSSVSVPLGNQGQIAYVSGNAYMETLASYRNGLGLPATCLQLGAWESKLVQNLDFSIGFMHPIKHEKGIPLLLKAMLTPTTVQVIADFDIEKLASVPAYARDPHFCNILGGAALTPRKASLRGTLTKGEAANIMFDILQTILELQSSEQLELADSLMSCGIDSISFAQIRGRVMNQLEVEIPMMFLSDSFTVNDMISHVVNKYGS